MAKLLCTPKQLGDCKLNLHAFGGTPCIYCEWLQGKRSYPTKEEWEKHLGLSCGKTTKY